MSEETPIKPEEIPSSEYRNLEEKYALLLDEKIKNFKPSVEDRIAELELKMAKLWDLLTDKTERRKETKITKFGKGFKQKFNTRSR